MSIDKKKITPVVLISIFFLMLGLSFAAVPLYDLFCRVTGFGGTTQNASNKEIPKIIVNQDYKMRFDTNINSTLNWKFTPEIKTLDLKPGEVHTVKFYVENPNNELSSGSASFNVSPASNVSAIGNIDVTSPGVGAALGLNPTDQAIAARRKPQSPLSANIEQFGEIFNR